MNRNPVVSSQVKSLGHDPSTSELHVEYHDGSVWVYGGVSTERHAELVGSKSIGKNLHGIKTAGVTHPARKLEVVQ